MLGSIALVILIGIAGSHIYYKVQKFKYKDILLDAEQKIQKSLVRIDKAGKDEFSEQQMVRKRVYEWEKKNEKDKIKEEILNHLMLDNPLFHHPVEAEEVNFIESAKKKF